MEDGEVVASDAAGGGGNPLLVGAPPVEETVDRHIRAMITTNDNIYFDQWKKKYTQGTPTRLRAALTQLLPTLIGVRDYAGAAKVLAVMYHRFSVTPALCVEKMLLLKELLLFYIIHGEFYEAYRLYQDKIQNFSGFLEKYYPDSVDAQVSVYIRWMKADPSCSYALEKIMELSSAGAISSYSLTKALVEALDFFSDATEPASTKNGPNSVLQHAIY
ncbi:hypothetical protein BBO99_00001791 [Phytophthora kernoviae]|uniref:Uncharacterized protein n=2 Tax=Phytophthora kernoviae TaxID=325452 RepID=A0A3R7H3K2_9STRA|nr:hypothetical protein G195_002575 [Phytophthora kernoviae 00238/432]KAG2526133.1 hypothetical protein JM16_004085 [Phytophthora kernoviae]KAG2532088.1 hypothetical protein JM18_001440 [Phytophthora kernoviae]RLN27167.1 hypothetical protein BBI17_001562 [Phytophthora kernoviae]RLN83827.1 hypothetical protein BBO99_00001791 [Phytophthora kernoviae]